MFKKHFKLIFICSHLVSWQQHQLSKSMSCFGCKLFSGFPLGGPTQKIFHMISLTINLTTNHQQGNISIVYIIISILKITCLCFFLLCFGYYSGHICAGESWGEVVPMVSWLGGMKRFLGVVEMRKSTQLWSLSD